MPPVRKPPHFGTQVWVAFSSMANPYSGLLLDGLLAEAHALETTVVIAQWADSEDHPPRPSSQWIRMGLARGAQGFVLVTTPVTQEHLDACESGRAPLMVVDPDSHAPEGALSVAATNWRGGVQATEHLLHLGHRRIAFIGSPPESRPGNERLAGFRSALESAGIPYDPRLVLNGRYRFEDGLASVDMLRSVERPTAVFTANDGVACGVMEAARRLGLSVPDDLSVIGFDDSFAAMGASPQLTTVRQSLIDMGRLALRSCVNVLRGNAGITPHVQLATTLIQRGSTGPVRRPSS